MTAPVTTAAKLTLTDPEIEEMEKMLDDYKKLNEKCDVVISRVKDRKEKQKK